VIRLLTLHIESITVRLVDTRFAIEQTKAFRVILHVCAHVQAILETFAEQYLIMNSGIPERGQDRRTNISN
jgi:hypothetical protein